MKIRTSLLAALLISSAAARDADAGLIALFNFNDATNGANSPANTTALFTRDGGTSGALSSNFAAADITAFAGTATNAQGGDVAGQALALQGGTGNANNGRFLQFSGSTVGNTAIQVSFAIQRTGTGFNSDQFQVSTDGANFVNFGSAFTPVASFTPAPNGLVSFDLSSITALNNNANFAFRIIFNGVSSAAGNNRIDNLVISGTDITAAVPEPASVAMLGLGLVGVLAFARRKARPAR